MLDEYRHLSIEAYYGLLYTQSNPKLVVSRCAHPMLLNIEPMEQVAVAVESRDGLQLGPEQWHSWVAALVSPILRTPESCSGYEKRHWEIWETLKFAPDPWISLCALCPWCFCQTHSLHEVVVSSTWLTQISWFRMFGRIPIHNMSPWHHLRSYRCGLDVPLQTGGSVLPLASRMTTCPADQAFDVTGMHKSWSCFPSYNRSFFVPDVLLEASLKFLCSVWSNCIAPYSSSCFICKSEVWLRERRREIWRCKRVQCRNIGVASIGHDLLRHWELFPCLPRWTSHTSFIIHYIWQVCVVCWVWTMMRRVSQVRLQELLSGLWHVKIKIQTPWCYLNPCVVRVPCHPAHCATLQDPRDLVERVWLPVYKFEAVWGHVCLSMPPQFQLCQVNTANTM